MSERDQNSQTQSEEEEFDDWYVTLRKRMAANTDEDLPGTKGFLAQDAEVRGTDVAGNNH